MSTDWLSPFELWLCGKAGRTGRAAGQNPAQGAGAEAATVRLPKTACHVAAGRDSDQP